MRRIKEHYASVGFLDAKVTRRLSADAHQNVEIIFEINEGSLKKIVGAYLHYGVTNLQAFIVENLICVLKLLYLKTSSIFRWDPSVSMPPIFLTKPRISDKKLTSLYAQKGYPYAHVTLEQKENESGVELHYHLDPDVTFKTQKSLRAFKQNLPPVLLGEILFDEVTYQVRRPVFRREMGLPENYRNVPLDPILPF